MRTGGQRRRRDARGVHRGRPSPARRPPISTPPHARCSIAGGARSNFLGYHGFPAVACISPNEVIVHGIPGDRVLDDGDIVSIDCGAIIEGWHADAAITIPVGDDRRRVPAPDRRHPGVARGRDRARSGRATGSATSARPCEAWSPRRGLRRRAGVRRPRHRHRDARGARGAQLRDRPGRGLRLRPGMVLAIEPMVNAGKRDDPAARRRLDRRDRRRRAARPTSSTPSPSPTTAPRS